MSKPQAAPPRQEIHYVTPPQYTVVQVIPQSAVPACVCPMCGYTVTPMISFEPSLFAWVLCISISILLMPFFFIGFLIGYCILVADAMQEPRYICPLCGYTIGIAIL